MTTMIKKGSNIYNVPLFFQKLFFTFLSSFLLSCSIYSQDNVFSAQIITDLNFSQIDGDLMAGYDRIGFGAGLGVSYALAPQWAAHIELMYRNVGARSSYFDPIKRSIDIQQAQIPLYASYRTWWVNGLSKFHFDGGFLYGRNVRTKINFSRFENNYKFIRNNDYSLLVG